MSGPRLQRYAWVLLSAVCYLLLGYFVPRSNFYALLLLFGPAFLAYYVLLRSSLPVWEGCLLALGLRLLLIGCLPALSDDYFRFIWDGRLLLNGENPYLHVPAYFLQAKGLSLAGITPELFQNLNSPQYYSVYPPVCQFIFWLAALLSPQSLLESVVVMRLFILAAEAGTFFLLARLLQALHLPARHLLWYALNPLVIVELTGNLHCEALMIFFLLGALYLLHRQWRLFSALSFGLAVGVKLLPLMFLPLLLGRLGLRQFSLYCLTVGLSVGVLFSPFLSAEMFGNLFSSLNLYFQTFEFNASLYYLARWLGYLFSGYNQIARIGVLFSALTFASILYLAYRIRKAPFIPLPPVFLAALTLYLLLSTTVHPWYLTTLVALSACTRWRYPVVWSGMAVLSYAAYRTAAYEENLWLVWLEYTVVLVWVGVEWKRKDPQQPI